MTGTEDRFRLEDVGPLSAARAIQELTARLRPVTGLETVPLRAAAGRILGEDVVAERDVPPHDNAAMDGYAVFSADLSDDGETRLPVTGRIAAGHPLDRPARPGEALRIFTGAPMPDGPDTVVKQEDVKLDGDTVTLPPGVKPGQHRRKRGEDVKKGDVIIPSGRRLRPQEVGLAASAGRASLLVRVPLRAAVFSTGDEIRDPGQETPPGCVFDANRHAVIALLEGLGCAVTDLDILPDKPEVIRDALGAAAPGHDLLVTSGGVSMGEEDHVKGAVEAQGSLHFWKLAIKPGKPIALGQVGETAFIGLPGNPVAAMVTFLMIGRAVVLSLAGRTDLDPPRFAVPAGFETARKPGRREWLRGRLETEKGRLVARKYLAEGSGILTSMVASDGLIEVPEDKAEIAYGEAVDFIPFSEVLR